MENLTDSFVEASKLPKKTVAASNNGKPQKKRYNFEPDLVSTLAAIGASRKSDSTDEHR